MTSKKEKTRKYILEKSYELFALKGFNAVSMKDVCEACALSRGGLYSHFSGTREIFETILSGLNEKNEMNFQKEMEKGAGAAEILDNALASLEEEMQHPEESLSLAMYEYAGVVGKDYMDFLNEKGEKKWTALIEYGIWRGEFQPVDVQEIVNVLLYAYQGVRMWSRIVTMKPETAKMLTGYIRKQLIK